MIKLRKAYKEFRLESNEDIEREIRFLENNESKVVSFTISNKIVVIHNANEKDITATIPEGNWSVLANEYKAGVEELSCI
ncbi:type I pullulanase, partial [Clostridium perfringens]|nr:type I pullulanase [Clostridium perfringens]